MLALVCTQMPSLARSTPKRSQGWTHRALGTTSWAESSWTRRLGPTSAPRPKTCNPVRHSLCPSLTSSLAPLTPHLCSAARYDGPITKGTAHNGPGPKYNAMPTEYRAIPAYSIGSSKRPPLSRPTGGPGPGDSQPLENTCIISATQPPIVPRWPAIARFSQIRLRTLTLP